MLKADSSTLKNESEVQSSATPPMIPSVAAFRCTDWTALTIADTEVPGKTFFNSVIFERGGKVVGSTLADQGRAKEVADEAEALLTEAEQRRDDVDEGEFAQLEVAVQAGSVFIVRDGDRMIAATTPPEPTVGLV